MKSNSKWIILTVPHAGCSSQFVIKKFRECDELAKKSALLIEENLKKQKEEIKVKTFISKVKRTKDIDENRFSQYTKNESKMWKDFESFSSENNQDIYFALDVHSFYKESPATPYGVADENIEVYVLEDSPTSYSSKFIDILKLNGINAGLYRGENNAIHETFRRVYNIKSFLIEFREDLEDYRINEICKIVADAIIETFVKDKIRKISIPSQSGNIYFEIIGEKIFHKTPGSDFSIKPFKLEKLSWKKLSKKIMDNDVKNIESFIDFHNNKLISFPPEKRRAKDDDDDESDIKKLKKEEEEKYEWEYYSEYEEEEEEEEEEPPSKNLRSFLLTKEEKEEMKREIEEKKRKKEERELRKWLKERDNPDLMELYKEGKEEVVSNETREERENREYKEFLKEQEDFKREQEHQNQMKYLKKLEEVSKNKISYLKEQQEEGLMKEKEARELEEELKRNEEILRQEELERLKEKKRQKLEKYKEKYAEDIRQQKEEIEKGKGIEFEESLIPELPIEMIIYMMDYMDVSGLTGLYENYLSSRGELKYLIAHLLIKKKRILWKNRGYYIEFFKNYEKSYGRTLKFEPVGYIFEEDDLIIGTSHEGFGSVYNLPKYYENISEIEIKKTRLFNIYIKEPIKKIICPLDLYLEYPEFIEFIQCNYLTLDNFQNANYPLLKHLQCTNSTLNISKFKQIEYLKYNHFGGTLYSSNHQPSLKILNIPHIVFIFPHRDSNLEELICEKLEMNSNNVLPKNLKKLSVLRSIFHVRMFENIFLENLETLIIPNNNYPLNATFNTLKNLEVYNINVILPNLKKLKIRGEELPENLDKFTSLEEFEFSILNIGQFKNYKFPIGLKVISHDLDLRFEDIYNDDPVLLNLPNSLEILNLKFIHPDQKFPESLIDLKLWNIFSTKFKRRTLKISLKHNSKLKFLKIFNNSKNERMKTYMTSFNFELIDNPLSDLEELDLENSNYNRDIKNLPHNLSILKLGKKYSGYIFEKALPLTLKTLSLDKYKFSKLPILPSSLLDLKFGDHFDTKITKIPPYLRTLEIGKNYNRQLPELSPYLLEFRWKDSKELKFKKLKGDNFFILKIPSYTILREIPHNFIDLVAIENEILEVNKTSKENSKHTYLRKKIDATRIYEKSRKELENTYTLFQQDKENELMKLKKDFEDELKFLDKEGEKDSQVLDEIKERRLKTMKEDASKIYKSNYFFVHYSYKDKDKKK